MVLLLALASVARATPLDPDGFAAIDAVFAPQGDVVVDTSALTLTEGAVVVNGVDAGGIAVFTFGEGDVPAGVALTVTGSRPAALLAQGSARDGGHDHRLADGENAGPGGYAGGHCVDGEGLEQLVRGRRGRIRRRRRGVRRRRRGRHRLRGPGAGAGGRQRRRVGGQRRRLQDPYGGGGGGATSSARAPSRSTARSGPRVAPGRTGTSRAARGTPRAAARAAGSWSTPSRAAPAAAPCTPGGATAGGGSTAPARTAAVAAAGGSSSRASTSPGARSTLPAAPG
ncbi:MAG: hypothetical protein R3F59_37215 [Myxococcota bacterium]